MAFLSESERRTLAAICDTLIPSLAGEAGQSATFHYSASDSDIVTRLEATYEVVASEEDRQELQWLLRAFDMGAFNLLFGGKWKPFAQMSLTEREDLLQRWATSRLFTRRKAFQGIKRLALFLGYSNLPALEQHPAWVDFHYPGAPGGADDIPRGIKPLQLYAPTTLTCDVLVIGSGAGGGVVAGELAAAGYDVIVAEKGAYYAEADFDGNEHNASERLFEKRGALTTADTALMVLAGTALGGGTVVNWSASFRTPEHVLREWAHEYGLRDATSATWQQSLDAVQQRSHVTCDESSVNPNNAQFAKGVQALGYDLETIPRNVKGCEECGFCNYGCRFGAKQSTLKTYLQDAYDRGTRILVRANVRRVLHQRGAVQGAIMQVTDETGAVHEITVKAPVVVVSAGTLHTPAILLRSGLTNPNIGQHLHLHPTTPIFSIFEEPIRAWQGVPMSKVSKEFADLDGRGYGVTLEVAPAHPGLTSAILPWVGARDHKRLMAQMEHMANMIAITRDYYGGYIQLDRHGEPILHYQLHPYDAKHLQRGVLEMLKIHYAAGARQIFAPHAQRLSFAPDGRPASDFVRFLRRVEDAGLPSNGYPLFSAHQMSTARMAASPRQGALKPSGETWEINNLFVADGSAMPTATGVNPMMSIMGTAHYIAQQVKAAGS